jgi:nucleotide-binding universal stress UspA family protein
MKKILVPTDFSPLSEKALSVAAEISRKTKAEIELLHVIDSPNEGDFSASGDTLTGAGMNDLYILKSIELAKKNFYKILNDVKYVGIRFITKIKSGDVYHHLSDIIVKEKIDLIVMGTEGTTGLFKGIFNRSNTEEVVMHADCLVLSVKEGQKDFKIRNLVFTTDFKDYSPVFIKNLTDLQELFDFKLHLLYVDSVLNHTDNMDEVLINKEIFLKRFKIQNYEFHIHKDFTEYTGIIAYAEKIKADIIALSTHQQKGFWHWVGGLSEDLVNYANVPVLTYKAEK